MLRDDQTNRDQYRCLDHFSQETGLNKDHLVESFKIEQVYRQALLAEPSYQKRRVLYDELYTKAFAIYGFDFALNIENPTTAKDETVETFLPELQGKRILDVGCGSGDFIFACARKAGPKRLVGLDVFVENTVVEQHNAEFIRRDVVRFTLPEVFDVAMSDNVFEHIAPQDASDHLASIYQSLDHGGKLILLTPHKLFGPWDSTRIIDDSYSGWTPPRASHLKEYDYRETMEHLMQAGFTSFQTIHPKSRLRYRDPTKRMDLSLFLKGEKRARFVRRLQAMEKKYRYPAFEVAIIAQKD